TGMPPRKCFWKPSAEAMPRRTESASLSYDSAGVHAHRSRCRNWRPAAGRRTFISVRAMRDVSSPAQSGRRTFALPSYMLQASPASVSISIWSPPDNCSASNHRKPGRRESKVSLVRLWPMRIPVIKGRIKKRLLVNFRADPGVVQRILPEPFRPKLHQGQSLAYAPSMNHLRGTHVSYHDGT